MMRFIIAIVLLVASLQKPSPTPVKASNPKQQQSATGQQPPGNDQRGTEQSPLVIKTLESTKSQAETQKEADDRKRKTANDGWVVILTGVLAIVAIGQLGVYLYQAIKLRETVRAAGEQSEAMERHINEAARSAAAMEKIANTIEAGNQAVMRAYLTVTVGIAIYQERREPGQSDLKFESRPNLLNTGNTPARKVQIQTVADILPIPLPADFPFPLTGGSETKDAGVVGAHQSCILAATVKEFVADHEVAAIKEARSKALCIWGLVTYEDIFGVSHKTRFGQWLTWNPDRTVLGYYIPGQNDSD
jgi:hypothetical protein